MEKFKNTLADSIACVAIAVLFYITAFFAAIFLLGLWALVASSAGLPSYGNGAGIAGAVLIGGLFTTLGTLAIGKICQELLER